MGRLFLNPTVDRFDLRQQFTLSTEPQGVPQGWLTERMGPWHLARHGALPLIRITSTEGGAIGWLLGFPIDRAGSLLEDGDEVVLPRQAVEQEDALETFLYAFGGRFAAVLLERVGPRLYLDPCGSLSAVYCAHQGTVASTPFLIPYDVETRDRSELAAALAIADSNAMYPLGLTPRHGVERVLPNHYLDLNTWRMVRHWPKQPLTECESAGAAVEAIAGIVKRHIRAVTEKPPSYLFLTAGIDSRMLLACSREVADKLEFVTMRIDDLSSEIDCDMARRMTRNYGLSHSLLRKEKPLKADMDEWLHRIGFCTGERRGMASATTYKRLQRGHALLKGNVGEVARGYYWGGKDTATTPIAPERLLRLCGCPPDADADALARAKAWLEAIPASNSLQVLDLFYIEQRLGCWAGVWPYSVCDAGFILFPMCHREIIENMLRLPEAYRRAGTLPKDIIRREWPELLDWPVNEPMGLVRWLFAIRQPQKAVRWLGQHLGGGRGQTH